MNVLLPLLQSQTRKHGATEHAKLTIILSDLKITTLNALKKVAQTPCLIGRQLCFSIINTSIY
jgi:hypothetical protein